MPEEVARRRKIDINFRADLVGVLDDWCARFDVSRAKLIDMLIVEQMRRYGIPAIGMGMPAELPPHPLDDFMEELERAADAGAVDEVAT